MTRKYDAIFLSPHFDDAVISCAGQILSETRKGCRVLVLTIFSSGGILPQQAELYMLRRVEDQLAVSQLGADTASLGFTDAPFRNPFYQSFRQIVLEEHPQDELTLCRLTEALAEVYQNSAPQRIYAPLGVGTHIDHRLVFAAAKAMSKQYNTVYYEDRPYAFVRGSVFQRIIALNVPFETLKLPDMPKHDFRNLRREFINSMRTAGYITTYLPPGPERFRCSLRLARRFRVHPDGEQLTLKPKHIPFGSDTLARAEKSLSAYQTQLQDLFGDTKCFVEQAMAYANFLHSESIYCERYWHYLEMESDN